MSLRRLLSAGLGPYRRLLLLVVVLQAVQATASLVLPAINAAIIDRGVLQGDTSFIWRMGLVMLAVSAVQLIFAVAAVWVGARVAMGFGRDVREQLFARVVGFSAREVGLFGAPSLITRVTNDVQQVQQLVVMGTTMMIAAPITMVVGIVMAVRQDVGLSRILVVAIPLVVVVLGAMVALMVPSFSRMQDRIDVVNAVLRDQVTGIRVVRAFVREPFEVAKFRAANDALTEVSLRAGRIQSAMFPTVMLIINLASVAVVWFGADRIAAGSMEPGSLVAYLTYLVQILMAVVMVTFMASMVPRASVSGGRIGEVLVTETSVVPPATPVQETPTRATVEFRDVSFQYPGADKPVLNGISFRVDPGTTCAIVGSTGAGKTTLVGLIPRLVDASDGEVVVDGVDVRQRSSEWLADHVSIVPQRPYLFSGSIASNLRVGRLDADEEDMWQALSVAQAADFVRELPRGLDSEVSQGGTNLSGGQRQRLAIARALIARPEIFVFDDSFSALDLVTDARLRSELGYYTSNAAVIVVAQRLSTVVDADQILVLDHGRLVGRGTHSELLESCPTYVEIADSQRAVAI